MRDMPVHADGGHTRRDFLRLAGAGAAASLAAAGTDFAHGAAPDAPSAAVKELPFELGLASYTLKEFSLEEALAMTKRVGLEHICLKSFHLPLDATPEQIAAAAAKVKEAGIDLYAGGVIRMGSEAEARAAFQYAKAAGMRLIVGAPVPDVLPLVNDLIREHGIGVAIHNHGPGDKVFPTPESAYEKIKMFDKRLGLCIDIGHTLRIGADPIRDVERFADRLLDVHIKDVTAAAPQGKTVEIGRGVIDIPQFLLALIKTGYAGIVSFEYEKDAKDPLPGLAESVGYVRGALAVLQAV